MQGNGTMTTYDGIEYVGQWYDDKMHGQGTMTYPDGRKYVGQFENNEFISE